jgi:hypothetical protein
LFALLQQFFDAGRYAWNLFEVDEMPSGIAANLLERSIGFDPAHTHNSPERGNRRLKGRVERWR